MKVFLDFIGCRLNQSELETIGNQFRYFDHIIVDDPHDADIAVVNTCTVTSNAAADSRKKIRQAHRAGINEIIVTGCWATLEADAAAMLSGVTQIVSNMDKDELVFNYLNKTIPKDEKYDIIRKPLPGQRQRTRAFIKVQDGCDNHCTYCITRIARGKGKSRSVSDIITDINNAYLGGAKEIVLSGVHLGSWGYDFVKKDKLTNLLSIILKETNVPRIRLSSIEPWDLDDGFFDLWRDERMCRHLHLPLQSGSASVLKRMARNVTPESYASIISKFRKILSQIAITTDVIVGFPGESDQEFQDSLSFIKSIGFSGGHVFPFSPRTGTAAARYENRIPKEITKCRSRIMREVFNDASHDYKKAHLNEQLCILWEKAKIVDDKLWQLEGLSDNYIRVKTLSDEKRWNQISKVNITEIEKDSVWGEIV